MSIGTEDIIAVCEALPDDKRSEVADLARFLLAKESDRRWEDIISNSAGYPKLDAFVKAALAERSAPLDIKAL